MSHLFGFESKHKHQRFYQVRFPTSVRPHDSGKTFMERPNYLYAFIRLEILKFNLRYDKSRKITHYI